ATSADISSVTARADTSMQLMFIPFSLEIPIYPPTLCDSLNGKYPNRPSLGNLRKLAGKLRIQPRLNGTRIEAPARLHGDVLFAVHQERRRRSDDPGVRREFPQQVSARRIESMQHSIVGPAAEHQPAAGGRQPGPAA